MHYLFFSPAMLLLFHTVDFICILRYFMCTIITFSCIHFPHHSDWKLHVSTPGNSMFQDQTIMWHKLSIHTHGDLFYAFTSSCFISVDVNFLFDSFSRFNFVCWHVFSVITTRLLLSFIYYSLQFLLYKHKQIICNGFMLTFLFFC